MPVAERKGSTIDAQGIETAASFFYDGNQQKYKLRNRAVVIFEMLIHPLFFFPIQDFYVFICEFVVMICFILQCHQFCSCEFMTEITSLFRSGSGIF
jgi:hypothetical protein